MDEEAEEELIVRQNFEKNVIIYCFTFTGFKSFFSKRNEISLEEIQK